MTNHAPLAGILDSRVDQRLDELARAQFGPPENTKEILLQRIKHHCTQRFTFGYTLAALVKQTRSEGFPPYLWVRLQPGKVKVYDIVWGPQWLQAALLLGLQKVPCVVVEATNMQMWEFAIIEHLQREPSDPIVEAQALHLLLDTDRYTPASLAACLGKDVAEIEQCLGLLNPAADIQALLETQKDMLSSALRLQTEMQRLDFVPNLTDDITTIRNILLDWKAFRADPVWRPRIDRALAYVHEGMMKLLASDAKKTGR
jgi:ParB/RepB/Spo0J family partition protein